MTREAGLTPDDGQAAVDPDIAAAASPANVAKMRKFVRSFAERSGSYLPENAEILEYLVVGLAKNIDEVGRPLCPCNFYEDKAAEAKLSTWACPCEEMQRFKYCH